MARLRRMVLPGEVHLVAQASRRDDPVFVEEERRRSYLGLLRDAAAEAGVAVHAYGLADSECRLLVTPSSADGLARMMQSLGRRAVGSLNRARGSSGSPWAGRYRSAIVEAARYLDALRFVEKVEPAAGDRDGDGFGSLDRSSAAHHLGAARSPFVADHAAFYALGNTPFDRELAYRRWLDDGDAASRAAAPIRAALAGWVYGSDEFAASVAQRAERRTERRAAGRPRLRSVPDS